jgi:hypothetical protein
LHLSQWFSSHILRDEETGRPPKWKLRTGIQQFNVAGYLWHVNGNRWVEMGEREEVTILPGPWMDVGGI